MLLAESHLKLKNKLLKIVEPYPEQYKNLLIEEITWIRLAKLESQINTDISNQIKNRDNKNGLLFPFLLGFTELDPIKEKISHQYMSNPDCPDIDSDIDSEHQKQMEDHLKERYGQNKVAHVATFMEWGAKQVVKDLCNILGIDFTTSNKITSLMMDDDSNLMDEIKYVKENIDMNHNVKTALSILEPYIEEWGEKMKGMIRQIGQHAAGIIITPEDYGTMVPTISKAGKILVGLREGQNNRELTDIGILKGDFLGLTACSIVNETLKLIDDPSFDIDKIDLNDKSILERFAKGDTECIFQFNGYGMIQLLKNINIESFEEINATVALFRPGPLRAGLDVAYIEGKKDPDNIFWIHEDIKPILGYTHGCMIFQEQQMEIMQVLGGFTPAEADGTRKIFKTLSKYTAEEALTYQPGIDMLKKFENGCREKGISDENVSYLVDQIKAFSGYSFNRSHSCCYAQVAYQIMVLRNYYPKEFYTVVHNISAGSKVFDPVVYKRLAHNDGVNILPIQIDKSEALYKIEGENIRAGFSVVKGVSKELKPIRGDVSTYEKILLEFSKNSWDKRKVDAAIFCGSTDHLFENRKKLYEIYMLWNTKVRPKLSGLTERSRLNYLNSMDEAGASKLQRDVLELCAKKISNRVKALQKYMSLGNISTLPNSNEIFEMFWSKHKNKFKENNINHSLEVDKIVEKVGDVEDWTDVEKNQQKIKQLGFDEVDLSLYGKQITEFDVAYSDKLSRFLAGEQNSFYIDKPEDEAKLCDDYFESNGLYFLGAVSSLVDGIVEKKDGSKKWNKLSIILSSERGSLRCSVTDWDSVGDPEDREDGCIRVVKSFMQVGDVVMIKAQKNEGNFINLCDIFERNKGETFKDHTSLVANFTRNVVLDPFKSFTQLNRA